MATEVEPLMKKSKQNGNNDQHDYINSKSLINFTGLTWKIDDPKEFFGVEDVDKHYEKPIRANIKDEERIYSNLKPGPNKFKKIIGKISNREFFIPDVNSGYYNGAPDSIASRMKIGVVIPSTNTTVENDYWRMLASNPELIKDVGLHSSDIFVRKIKWSSNEEMLEFLMALKLEMGYAIDRVMTSEPQYLILGISAAGFIQGMEGNNLLRNAIIERTNLGVATGPESVYYALKKFNAKTISVVTPYFPVMDLEVTNFYTKLGFEVKKVKGFKSESAVEIAHVTKEMCRQAIRDVYEDTGLDAIIQCGTDLAFVEVAEELEKELGIPIIAINCATLWFALRELGIEDKMYGCTRLCREF